MATDLIRYDLLVQDALRGVVRNVLSEAAKNGLQGDHHFFITFKTNAQGLRLSNRMRERYPDEMTIILQHQFWDLAVTESAFEVGLSFNKAPERLLVPFDAITSFVDPSVQFGLKFDATTDETTVESGADDTDAPEKPVIVVPAKRGLSAVEKTEKKSPIRSAEPVVALKPHESKPPAPIPPKAVPKAPVLSKVPDKPAPQPEKTEAGDGSKVVSIDTFRKKT